MRFSCLVCFFLCFIALLLAVHRGFAIFVPCTFFFSPLVLLCILKFLWVGQARSQSHDLWLALARAGHGEQFSGNRPISAQLADCHERCGLWHPTLEEVHQLRFPGRKEQGLATNLWKTCTSKFKRKHVDTSLKIIPQSIPVQSRTSQNRCGKAASFEDKWEKCCEKCGKDGIACSIQHHDAHCSRLTKQAGQVLLLFREDSWTYWIVSDTVDWNKVHPMGCLGTTLF